ncbi:substrate-binding protein [Halobium palmae]|uniref:Substrate-binding protein n=1 Tax=Halobium palmae TaxID=1776492 RepID=A0ABD5RZ98_9EURY
MARDTDLPSRRDVLKKTGAAGAVGIAGLAGCTGGGDGSGDGSNGGEGGSGGNGSGGNGSGGSGGGSSEDYPSIGNFPPEGDTVTLGFNVPQSGPYASEGEDELRAYKLAVEHLNNGGGWVDSQFDDLNGDGLLGMEVDFVSGDTATDADTARQSAQRMIQRDNVQMISGGSSSAVAIAVQELCQSEKVMFMCCLTHSNDTTGKNCVRYSFREMFNAYMTGQALAPVVKEEYGEGLEFYQLYADYSWGQTQQESMNKFLSEDAGWSQVESVPTPLGTSDYSSFLSEAANSGADVIVLNHYGLDGANSLSQAVDMGIDEDMELLVPLYNRPMAEAAGGAIGGVFGTVAWDSQIDNQPSKEFNQVFNEQYERTPSGPAQLAYAQTLQYAAAAERAGTLYPPEVIKQLEGLEYENIGMGQELMRKCDHQAQRDVPVVRGLPGNEQEQGQYFEIVNVTSRDQLGYGCDEGPAAECELGSYE